MRFWFHQGRFYDDLWQNLVNQQMSQQWTSMGVDAQTIAQMKAWLLPPEGRAGWLLAAVMPADHGAAAFCCCRRSSGGAIAGPQPPARGLGVLRSASQIRQRSSKLSAKPAQITFHFSTTCPGALTPRIIPRDKPERQAARDSIAGSPREQP